MSIAQVVPLRRFPANRPWFDYRVPEGLSVHPGYLVSVPFGRQQLDGIVWSLSEDSTIAGLKTIKDVRRPDPVLTEWQRQAIEKIASWYFVSLGHIVNSVVPTYPKRNNEVEVDWVERGHDRSFNRPPERLWWYRDRKQTQEQILAWLLHDDRLRVVCVPTREDLDQFMSALGPDDHRVAAVHGQLGEREYRILYERIRRGQVKKIIGTGRVFLLPYPTEPRWLLDQEEHPAHRQTEQHPRLDNRLTLAQLSTQPLRTTPAPSLSAWHAEHLYPPVFQGQRALSDLGQPGSRDWLTPDAEENINQTVSRGQSVIAIVPHHGFAQRLSCRECGWTLECSQCKRRVRISGQHGATATCGACQTSITIPVSCPRCHAVRWSMSGLGVDKFIATLRHRWPNLVVTSSEHSSTIQTGVIVGTYQDYRLHQHHQDIGATIVVCGDALLSYPDFAVAERAWTWLARLQAEAPQKPVLVQTYEPQLPFWQRWRHGDDRSWYEDEIRQRTTLALPPLAEHWGVTGERLRASAIQNLLTEIRHDLPAGITISELTDSSRQAWRRPTTRLLIQAEPGIQLREAVPWLTLFPSPWQIDPMLRSWSD